MIDWLDSDLCWTLTCRDIRLSYERKAHKGSGNEKTPRKQKRRNLRERKCKEVERGVENAQIRIPKK